MLFNRRWLIGFLAVALLIRSAAGLAMQIDMAYALAKPKVNGAQTLPPCHDGAQNFAQLTLTDVSGTPTVQDSAQPSESGACALCCIAAAIPSRLIFALSSAQYSAPTAVLFNSLPAAAQRPSKPPLV